MHFALIAFGALLKFFKFSQKMRSTNVHEMTGAITINHFAPSIEFKNCGNEGTPLTQSNRKISELELSILILIEATAEKLLKIENISNWKTFLDEGLSKSYLRS